MVTAMMLRGGSTINLELGGEYIVDGDGKNEDAAAKVLLHDKVK